MRRHIESPITLLVLVQAFVLFFLHKANTKAYENSHTIYINGTAVFGGIEIK